MKNVLFFVLFAVTVIPANGETQFNLAGYNVGFNRIQRTGMVVLGSWAVLNFTGNGFPFLFISNDGSNGVLRNFMLMNIGWNVINAALAGSGYFTCCGKEPGTITLAETIKRQYIAEKTFLLNAGLDVGYIAFGLFLGELDESHTRQEMLAGFGYSLILQGSALFVFDLAMQIIHAIHRRELDSYLAGMH